MNIAEIIEQQQKAALSDLIGWAGGQSRLATRLGVSEQVITNWVRRGRISAKAAILAEQKSNGLIKKEQLRPEVKTWLV